MNLPFDIRIIILAYSLDEVLSRKAKTLYNIDPVAFRLAAKHIIASPTLPSKDETLIYLAHPRECQPHLKAERGYLFLTRHFLDQYEPYSYNNYLMRAAEKVITTLPNSFLIEELIFMPIRR